MFWFWEFGASSMLSVSSSPPWVPVGLQIHLLLQFCTCRLSTRPGVGGIRSRVGIQHSLLSQPTRTATFQQRFDARQKIGISDARLKLGVKDAREKLLQKDARFRIKGKVQDAREMLNSRKQQSTVPQNPWQVADAREKISLKRRSPATFTSPPIGTVTPALKLTKTIQVGSGSCLHFQKPGR